jgi:hypothetical protein
MSRLGGTGAEARAAGEPGVAQRQAPAYTARNETGTGTLSADDGRTTMAEPGRTVTINRAPVLTLWAAVVAERLGFEPAEALTLGRALAGLTAQAKGMRLGIFEPSAPEEVHERRQRLGEGERLEVQLLGRTLLVVRTPEGLRALDKGRPARVERYLAGKFGQDLEAVRGAMQALAGSMPPAELARRAFALYERFRPGVPSGEAGWGAKGVLALDRIRSAAEEGSQA